MDFLTKAPVGSGDRPDGSRDSERSHQTQPPEDGGGLFGRLKNMASVGRPESEGSEDSLDKALDYLQQHMGGGDQSNESAIEQAKDEQISDFIRAELKGTTGKDFAVVDK